MIPGTRLEFCHPRHLRPVAERFPDLAVVMAHGGRGHWYDECARLLADFPNTYVDVTGLVPARLLEHFPTLPDHPDRYIFGSDWPAMPKSVQHNARVIRDDLGLDRSAVDHVLRRNAARLLGLPLPEAGEAPDRIVRRSRNAPPPAPDSHEQSR